MRVLKVAIYMARFFPAVGGIINYVINLVRELVKHNIHIEIHVDNVVLTNKGKVTLPKGKIFTSRIVLIPETVLIPSLHLRFVKNGEADIINIHGHAEVYTLNILTRLSKPRKPVILTSHGSLISSLYGIDKGISYGRIPYVVGIKLKRKIASKISIGVIAKYVDMIVTPSEVERKALMVYDIPSHRIAIIKNFVPDSYFGFKSRESEILLEKFGLEPYEYVITVARVDYNKSIHQVIKAVSDLYDQGINIKYVLIGPDEGALSHCLALVKKNNIEKNITYLGTIIDKGVILTLERYALAFVLPSYIEGAQPLSILEAMSQSTPVIISNTANFIGGAIRHMFNGLVFNYGNIQSLVQSIRMLFEDENLRRKLGGNAFRYAYEHHRLSKAVNRYVKIFRTLYEIYYNS